jgi:hypothetical protein
VSKIEQLNNELKRINSKIKLVVVVLEKSEFKPNSSRNSKGSKFLDSNSLRKNSVLNWLNWLSKRQDNLNASTFEINNNSQIRKTKLVVPEEEAK